MFKLRRTHKLVGWKNQHFVRLMKRKEKCIFIINVNNFGQHQSCSCELFSQKKQSSSELSIQNGCFAFQ